MTMERFTAEALADWATALLQAWDYRADDAAYLAQTLLDANIRGTDSHGLIRLAAYRRRIEAGLVDPAARPVVTIDGSVIRVDAAGATGQIAAREAVSALVEVASSTGIAMAAVSGSTHFGAAGFYARQLAAAGMIGMVVSNSEPIVVPFGGRRSLLGTNPLAFAAPVGAGREPVSLDMATSTSAMGKVLVARNAGDAIPDTWGVDADGHPTTDPHAVTALLPVGGPKGYGLGFMVEILAGVLTGAAVGEGIGNLYTDFDRPQDVGHWMMAIDVAHLAPLVDFGTRLQGLIDSAHGTPTAPGHDAVLVPGEPETRTAAARLADGIGIDGTTVIELTQLGRSHGLTFPTPLAS